MNIDIDYADQLEITHCLRGLLDVLKCLDNDDVDTYGALDNFESLVERLIRIGIIEQPPAYHISPEMSLAEWWINPSERPVRTKQQEF